MSVDSLWNFSAALFVGSAVSGLTLFLGSKSAMDRAVLMRDVDKPSGIAGFFGRNWVCHLFATSPPPERATNSQYKALDK